MREVSRTDKETGKNDQPGGKDHGKRPDSGQPAKTARLEIHEERTLAVDDGPEGSRFIGHRAFTVQDLRIGPQNTLFLLERGATSDGRVLTAACPPELGGPHFWSGPACLHSVPAPPLPRQAAETAQQLREWGLELSVAQIDALLASGQVAFSAEKATCSKPAWRSVRPSPSKTPPRATKARTATSPSSAPDLRLVGQRRQQEPCRLSDPPA
ncbi:MAG: hypothetical protein J0M13_11825 [Candidatus Accumulibacter sp.]|nr:hypothetical protein [Candidatus Accumulibacter necessarius]